MICRILATTVAPKERKVLEREAEKRGCELCQVLAAAVCEAILQRYWVAERNEWGSG